MRFYYLQIVSLIFIYFFFGDNIYTWISLITILLLGYLSHLIVVYLRSSVLAYIFILSYLFLIAIYKDYINIGLSIIQFIGFSYIIFRQIHILFLSMDVKKYISIQDYILYQTNLFTFLAGPLMKFPHFEKQLKTTEEINIEFNDTSVWIRMIKGFVKCGIGTVLLIYIANLQHPSALTVSDLTTIKFDELNFFILNFEIIKKIIIFFLFPISIYLNFSGYCCLVISSGRLFGIEIPENFNKPWLSRNLIDFWSRWHITLSSWMRDYVYIFFLRKINSIDNVRSNNLIMEFFSIILLFITFLFIGLWHGNSLSFIYYALTQAFGVCFVQIWGKLLKVFLSKESFNNYMTSSPIRIFSIIITLNYVCFSFYLFSSDAAFKGF